jgi:argininosuccinate lyase
MRLRSSRRYLVEETMPEAEPTKTWGGRFTGGTDARVEAFTESISFDARLAEFDITASQAHARMLSHVGLLTSDEATQITKALNEIKADIAAGRMAYTTSLEDIHTHIEQALIKKLGDVGRKLHTARSRNDQIVTDVKLWVRHSIDDLSRALGKLQQAFITLADIDGQVILPGYTHLQRAQPVLAAHYLLAFVEKLERDRTRLADCRRRLNELPLGAGALAGSSLPIDRHFTAKELGFDRPAANSLDVSSDRDFLIEFVFDLSLIALHLAGWAEEWIIWSTSEYSFIVLPDAFCTGSSMMPHKKNPDVLELIRGKSARVLGSLHQLMVLVKGLPLAYNRDLQEDKPAAFAAYDTVLACVEIAAPLIEQTRFNRESIASRLHTGFLDATTVMELLVKEGIPLRTAHETVGNLVRLCEEKQCGLKDLPKEAYDAVRPGLSQRVYPVLGVEQALQAFCSVGSTGPNAVQAQLDAWRERLGKLDQI